MTTSNTPASSLLTPHSSLFTPAPSPLTLHSSRPVIRVSGLSKEYVIGRRERGRETFREMVTSSLAAPFRRLRRLGSEAAPEERFWALRDVSFEVQRGEVVGIIGRNGAGKSTLLKILSRITDPTEGEVEIRGRVASLLEVGTGFHAELTGRENIYLNGAILGMSRREIDRKFDEIVDFSGVEKFIDTPVKRYSSGMAVRLAFAVAAHLEPEILVIDEVLAVGDIEFQKKCLGKMDDVARSGRTILFVSHNMAAIDGLCSQAIFLESGKVVEYGKTAYILSQYQTMVSQTVSSCSNLASHPRRGKGAENIMLEVYLENSGCKKTAVFYIGEDLKVCVSFQRIGRPFRPVLGLVFKSHLGVPIFSLDNRFIPGYIFEPVTAGVITCRVPKLPLMPGRYSLDLYLGDENQSLDRIMEAINFDIIPTDIYNSGRLPYSHSGSVVWKGEWVLEDT